jgi:hypothetical protein
MARYDSKFDRLKVVVSIIDKIEFERRAKLIGLINQSPAEKRLEEQNDFSLQLFHEESHFLSNLAMEILTMKYIRGDNDAGLADVLKAKVEKAFIATDQEDSLHSLLKFTHLASAFALVTGPEIYDRIRNSLRRRLKGKPYEGQLVFFVEILRFIPLDQSGQDIRLILEQIPKLVYREHSNEQAIELSVKLAHLLAELSDIKCYNLLEEFLPQLAKRDRISFSLIIYSLSPVFLKLWGDISIEIILSEMNKVRSWWP